MIGAGRGTAIGGTYSRPAAEFTSVQRDVPRALIRILMGLTFTFGIVLTLSIPWTLNRAIFGDARFVDWGVIGLIWGGFLLVLGTLIMIRWCIVQGLAFLAYNGRSRQRGANAPTGLPFVSILVPAYNESDTIVSALKSFIELDYPRFEVIVIDDGSSDDTFAKAKPMEGKYKNCVVRVYTKPNGGKWSALNLGFEHATGKLLLCVDADSRLSRDALLHLVPRLREPGVVGVSGQVTVHNRRTLLTRFQAVEYLLGNGGMRMALSRLGTVTVVPGPIGLYRRSVMEAIRKLPCNQRRTGAHGSDDGAVYGPLSGETFAEDFQLSLSGLALGGRIVYEPDAFAYTKAPEQIDVLLNQRYRWMRGTWQVAQLYFRELRHFVPASERLRVNALILSIYTLDIYVVPILNFLFWFWVVMAIGQGLPLGGITSWIGAVILLNMMTTMVYILEQGDDLLQLALVPFLDLYQSLMINSAWVIAAVDQIRGTRMKWM